MGKSHGLSHTRLYRIWEGMKSRCYRTDNVNYDRYGGRGIRICKEWLDDFVVFYDWAIQHGYNENLTIDREDNSKGYTPQNCRWVTIREQNINRKYTPRKRVIIWIIDGVKKTALEWCEQYGISYQTVRYRINKMGMAPYEALTSIVYTGRPRKEE